MTGPSAIGSENGKPTSIKLAPASSSAGSTPRVVATSGNPAATNGISAICLRWRKPANVSAIETRGRAGDVVAAEAVAELIKRAMIRVAHGGLKRTARVVLNKRERPFQTVPGPPARPRLLA